MRVCVSQTWAPVWGPQWAPTKGTRGHRWFARQKEMKCVKSFKGNVGPWKWECKYSPTAQTAPISLQPTPKFLVISHDLETRYQLSVANCDKSPQTPRGGHTISSSECFSGVYRSWGGLGIGLGWAGSPQVGLSWVGPALASRDVSARTVSVLRVVSHTWEGQADLVLLAKVSVRGSKKVHEAS